MAHGESVGCSRKIGDFVLSEVAKHRPHKGVPITGVCPTGSLRPKCPAQVSGPKDGNHVPGTTAEADTESRHGEGNARLFSPAAKIGSGTRPVNMAVAWWSGKADEGKGVCKSINPGHGRRSVEGRDYFLGTETEK